MLKTFDILIGVTTVLLLFSMAVTLITQTVTTILQRRGKHLLSGLADLMQQLGIPDRSCAEKIAATLLTHPLIAEPGGKLGMVIHRAEFIKLLLDFAGGNSASVLEEDARKALIATLARNGISDPETTLKNIWAMSLQLEGSNPELANHVRDGLAIVHEGASDFVARVHFWFDQTIDRVNHRFARSTHWVTLGAAALVTLTLQLDVIAVIDRLSVDEQTRAAFVSQATRQYAAESANGAPDLMTDMAAYSLFNSAGLITLPSSENWLRQFTYTRKWPGMALSILLLSLGAPFWYNVLKDLIGLRSQLARNDEAQRWQRQTTQPTPDPDEAVPSITAPAWLSGECGDLAAVA
jgi:hypothetical protein